MNVRHPCFVAFKVDNVARFEALRAAYEAIKHDKDTDEWRVEEDWLSFFDDEALAYFWWPTKEETEAYWARWWGTPIPQRWTDPAVQAPSWDFLSMIDAFKNGEYELQACRLVDEGHGQLEFDPWAFPYGGTGCMRMLIRAFGFEVTAEEDGTGYRPA